MKSGPAGVFVQVLTALQRLVSVMGPESVACYPLLLPMLRYCTDISQVALSRLRTRCLGGVNGLLLNACEGCS